MSIFPSSRRTAEAKNHFPEQRVQTIADALGVYLTTSFCDSIVHHSGQSLEELAAQSHAMESNATPVAPNDKSSCGGHPADKSYRRRPAKGLGWGTCPSPHETLLQTLMP